MLDWDADTFRGWQAWCIRYPGPEECIAILGNIVAATGGAKSMPPGIFGDWWGLPASIRAIQAKKAALSSFKAISVRMYPQKDEEKE